MWVRQLNECLYAAVSRENALCLWIVTSLFKVIRTEQCLFRFKVKFSCNLCLPCSASNTATVHINTTRSRRARRRLVVLKRCSLLGNSGSRTGIWLNWAEHMSPAFMLQSISTNVTDPGQHPRAKSLLPASFKQLPSVKSVHRNNSLCSENRTVEMQET